MSSWKKILTEEDIKSNLNGSTDIVSNATVTSAVNNKANSVHNHDVVDDVTDLIDSIYPVGAIYISTNNVNPSTLFGGTWTKIEDKFLLASTNGQGVGQTGGYTDATLVTHNHTQDSHTHTQDSHTHTLGSSKNFLTIKGDNWQYSSKRSMTSSSGSRYYPYASSNTGGIDQFSATNTTTATNQDATATNQYTGEDPTNKNFPPYLAVNIWKRTE